MPQSSASGHTRGWLCDRLANQPLTLHTAPTEQPKDRAAMKPGCVPLLFCRTRTATASGSSGRQSLRSLSGVARELGLNVEFTGMVRDPAPLPVGLGCLGLALVMPPSWKDSCAGVLA